MYELHYTDSYKIDRSLTFEQYSDLTRQFLGCLAIPDYLKVTSFTFNGEELGFQGTLGDVYNFISSDSFPKT
ncbi:DUF4649 family protein [Streptococcus danieliae]|uniref:DUF4649 family protein n=1 Tax=Streptococcus danieliae TaxID=747656 RepID=A0A7X3G8W0_9STRE|nr:DUF4649 family protein [Streptococcus danieliae]MBF0717623.1 DUF4649 family protein [Streptococcus danieliae]MCU0082192.1 DUF4649 family protein [Streptococcus danieliae]MVX59268.1 DUF4649 family protein [Streptococcus danieliae]NYS32796.1 DUF4649 family protein [Streptococcus danieliae]NYS49553.1 DUF4649 family protein [Streptococcus danieliae]